MLLHVLPAYSSHTQPYGQRACMPVAAFAGVAVGYSHSCAVVTAARRVVCDGSNDAGQATPPADLSNVTSLCAGYSHSCAVSGGKVVCWGDNTVAQAAPPASLTNAVLVRCGSEFICVSLFDARTSHGVIWMGCQSGCSSF